MMKLLETLRQKQKELGLTDTQFSELIGVSRPTWWLAREGRRNPGVGFLRGVLKAFPDTREAVYDYIAGN
jgi:transcriptional regulator with XRE-family HTH domain